MLTFCPCSPFNERLSFDGAFHACTQACLVSQTQGSLDKGAVVLSTQWLLGGMGDDVGVHLLVRMSHK